MGPSRPERHLQSRFNPLRGLTPARLTQYLQEYRAGDLRNLALILQLMEERDGIWNATAAKRRQALARQGWDVLTVDHRPGQKAQARAQQEALEGFYNRLEARDCLEEDQRGGVQLLVRQMMTAPVSGKSAHHLVWGNQGRELTCEAWYVPLQFFESRKGRLRFLPDEASYDGVELEPERWLITCADACGPALAVAYMYKVLPLRDWLSYTGKFGLPGIVLTTDAAKGSPEWDEALAAVNTLANDWAAVFSQGANIQLLEAKGGTSLPFSPLIERMERIQTLLLRGGDLGTLSSKDATGASLQQNESDVLLEDDAQLISETLRRLSRMVLDYYFGPDAPELAYIQIRVPQRINLELELKVDEWLTKRGVPQSIINVRERYGRPEPDGDDEVIGAQADPDPQPLPDPDERNPTSAANARRSVTPTDNERQAWIDFLNDLGLPGEWAAPLAGSWAALERRAASSGVTAEDAMRLYDELAEELPDMETNFETFAKALEGALGAALADAVTEKLAA